MDDLTFSEFMESVNHHLLELCGMGVEDLPDWRYRDDYETLTPLACAKRALHNADNYSEE